MLGVILLPAFTRLGHERQDHFSPCDGMHVCTDYTSVYTLIRKSVGGLEPETMLTPRGKTSTGGSNDVSHRAASPTHYRLSYSGPLKITSDLRLGVSVIRSRQVAAQFLSRSCAPN